MEFMEFLVCLTLILFSSCCAVYLTKEILYGGLQFIKTLVSELNKIEEKENKDM